MKCEQVVQSQKANIIFVDGWGTLCTCTVMVPGH